MTIPRILPPWDGFTSTADVRMRGQGTRAVVAFSGGQDSTTCLFYALGRYGHSNVHAVSFNYGQTHAVELGCARLICERQHVPHTVVDVPAFSQLADAALTNPDIPVEATAGEHDVGDNNWHAISRGLPSTFVPGRNIVFLSLAAAYGIPRGATVLVTGVCEQDRAGYPDCRREFVAALVDAIRLGTDTPEFTVDAPLLDRDKAQTWQLADDLGVLDTVINDTHTCYRGDRSVLHAWGRGCGTCPACQERARGWREYREHAYA
jgi:7-cyano-7-deazaguanine synthase